MQLQLLILALKQWVENEMNNIREFKKSFWSYYLELERQFIETKRYVEFSSDNDKAYSVEYLKLYQAICSEIDVVGKEIASDVVPGFKADSNTNIKKWGFNFQKVFGAIKDSEFEFDAR